MWWVTINSCHHENDSWRWLGRVNILFSKIVMFCLFWFAFCKFGCLNYEFRCWNVSVHFVFLFCATCTIVFIYFVCLLFMMDIMLWKMISHVDFVEMGDVFQRMDLRRWIVIWMQFFCQTKEVKYLTWCFQVGSKRN